MRLRELNNLLDNLNLRKISFFQSCHSKGPLSCRQNSTINNFDCVVDFVMVVLTPLAQLSAGVITNVHCYVNNIQYIWLLFLHHSVCFFHNGGGVRQGYRYRKLFFVTNKLAAALVAFMLLSAAFIDIRVLSSSGEGF